MSGELIARLSAYPKMKEVLDALPPKMLALATGKKAEPVKMEMNLEGRLEHSIKKIQAAKFTGKDSGFEEPGSEVEVVLDTNTHSATACSQVLLDYLLERS